MNFEKAKEISITKPGSVITRNELGDFIIRLPDGSVVSDSSVTGPEEALSSVRSKLDCVLRECREIETELEAEIQKRVELQAKVDYLSNKLRILEEKVSQVPDDVWQEIINRPIDNERMRLIGLVKSGSLKYQQIQQILDRASQFKFSAEERQIINAELEKLAFRESSLSPDSFVVHAKTDGQ